MGYHTHTSSLTPHPVLLDQDVYYYTHIILVKQLPMLDGLLTNRHLTSHYTPRLYVRWGLSRQSLLNRLRKIHNMSSPVGLSTSCPLNRQLLAVKATLIDTIRETHNYTALFLVCFTSVKVVLIRSDVFVSSL